VPEVYNVEFTTGAGNITIADLEGTIRGKTGAGNVILGDILGGIDISSGAGNIEVDGARDTFMPTLGLETLPYI
jgi:DUF4097 and DUF4098 domain-containing protein YvlB